MLIKQKFSFLVATALCLLCVTPKEAEANDYWALVMATDGEETFVIVGTDDEALVMRAKTSCEGVAESGDLVFFTSNPDACISSTFYNPRTDLFCDTWCD